MKQAALRNRNFPLMIGLGLTAVFLFIAAFGPSLAPLDPMIVFNDMMEIDGKTYIPVAIPIKPFELKQFVLGTDNVGRDLYSRLLNAFRPTLFLCLTIASVRLILGVLLGLLSGWYKGTVERIIDTLMSASLAVPILLFSLAALSFMGERTLINFIIALSLSGWANTAVFVKNRTQTVMQAPYIEGARAVGVKPGGILRRYVMPQLWPALPTLIAFELGAVLLLVAELGFLGMFIGDAFVQFVADPNTPGTIAVGLTASVPELGQMLSDFWSKMIKTPWEMGIVGTAVFLQIFAFNMLGEGMRRVMDVTRPRHSWVRRWRQNKQLASLQPDTPQAKVLA
ncbi:MAG: ABC transporter permease [Chloroflexi bacterium]|nr:ABC transporter permease [Chloroflexota bacterium]